MLQQELICFCYIFCLIGLVASDCNPQDGPLGRIDCVFSTQSSSFQLSACITRAYLSERSSGQLSCPGSGDRYCYIPCMADLGLTGQVTSQCRCAEGGTVTQSRLPADCLAPTQADCSWYSRCLAAQYSQLSCTGQTALSVSYGEKFCNLYNIPQSPASRSAQSWVDAVRRCFQIQLAPALRAYGLQQTCTALGSYISNAINQCYKNNSDKISQCDLSCKDFAYYFFQLKSSYGDQNLDVLKGLFNTIFQCSQSASNPVNLCGYQCENFYVQSGTVSEQCRNSAVFELTLVSNSLVVEEQAAYSFVKAVSDRFLWDSDTSIRWYVISSKAQRSDEISVQVFLADMAALGLMEGQNLGGMSEVIADLANAIRSGLTVSGDSNTQATISTLRTCNPYGEDLGDCRPGPVIASNSQLSSSGSEGGSSTSRGSSNANTRIIITPSREMKTTPNAGNTVSDNFITSRQNAGNTVSDNFITSRQNGDVTSSTTTRNDLTRDNYTPAFSTTSTPNGFPSSTTSQILSTLGFSTTTTKDNAASSRSNGAERNVTRPNITPGFTFSSTQGLEPRDSTTSMVSTRRSGFTPEGNTPGFSRSNGISSRDASSTRRMHVTPEKGAQSDEPGGDSTTKAAPLSNSMTRGFVTPPKSASSTEGFFTPPFSGRPTINP